jgi:hypothetical protein
MPKNIEIGPTIPKSRRKSPCPDIPIFELRPTNAPVLRLTTGVDRSNLRVPRPEEPDLLPALLTSGPYPPSGISTRDSFEQPYSYRDKLAQEQREGIYADLRTELTSDAIVNARLFTALQKKEFPLAPEGKKRDLVYTSPAAAAAAAAAAANAGKINEESSPLVVR